MFVEFFCHGTGWQSRTFAWCGLLLFVGHQIFRAWLKYRINEWYGTFYDLLQTHVVDGNAVGSGDAGSGTSSEEEDTMTLAQARQQVYTQLIMFAWIVAPALFVHPLAGLIKNWWVLRWRQSLMESYLRAWNVNVSPIEGASQRVHEDTERFASGIQSCVAVILDSFFTLAIFCPLLYSIDPPLVLIATVAAAGGVGISALVGQRLVGLEVDNQKVEAALRRQLVVLEVDPVAVVADGLVANGSNEPNGSNCVPTEGPLPAFRVTIGSLIANYRRLYFNFAALATWLTALDQTLVVLPYILVAPRLFASDPTQRMTLGALTQTANAFAKVFDSLNVLSDNFLSFNAWRSVVRRLREFERELYNLDPPVRRLVDANIELSDASEPRMQGEISLSTTRV